MKDIEQNSTPDSEVEAPAPIEKPVSVPAIDNTVNQQILNPNLNQEETVRIIDETATE
jgi:hypothetical protein